MEPSKDARGPHLVGYVHDVVLLATPADECIRRLRGDPARTHAVADLVNGVHRWHHLFRQADRVVVTKSA